MGRGQQSAAGARGVNRRSPARPNLSTQERKQLSTVRLRRDGTPSAHPYPSKEMWPKMWEHLVARSLRDNPALDTTLTAYTPGETMQLLEHPTIRSWHKGCVVAVPDEYETIVLVPCAKSKPWVGPAVRRSKLYSAYNTLREEMPDACFVTISEPLGIVPMADWSSFPSYDNPGLFRDDAQRSGMTKEQWDESPFGQTYGLPFDEEARAACISRLGGVVGEFLVNNQGKRIVSVVDSVSGAKSTHGEMLDVAVEMSGVEVERHPKRREARVSPLAYLREILS